MLNNFIYEILILVMTFITAKSCVKFFVTEYNHKDKVGPFADFSKALFFILLLLTLIAIK